jgi:flagella basal body P-ring formation protein FlgA
MREVVVANYPMPRHRLVQATDVRIERRDIGLLPHEPLRDPALVVGRRTTRMLAMGDVVLSDAVELPPLIQKGDVITLMVESPGLLVTAKGIAQEKGRAGDLVRVKNAASGREVFGKVESEKIVRVGL